MEELKTCAKYFGFFGGGFFFFLFLILLCCSSSGGSEEAVATQVFSVPFKDYVIYNISSRFGDRIDPIDKTSISFHSGLDMTAPINSEIVACGDGEVVEVGYSETGLGNYVYLKHDLGGLIYYSAYGHMLDNSIVVNVGDKVKMKDKLGIIGSTGKSTGTHLHFVMMKNELSFTKEYLIDPIILIEGL